MNSNILRKLALLCLIGPSLLLGQQPSAVRPVHTFSIVARDPQTGDLGWPCNRTGLRWAAR